MLEAFGGFIPDVVAMSVEYSYVFIYLSVLAAGEFAIFLSSLLIVDGTLNFFGVFIFSYAAVLSADFFWFLLGRYIPLHFVPQKFRVKSGDLIHKTMLYMFADRIFLPILLLKFFYGTRIISILYFARTPLSFTRFALYDAIGSLVYVSLFIGFGYLSSTTLSVFFPNLPFELLIGAGSLICLGAFVLLKTITRTFFK